MINEFFDTLLSFVGIGNDDFVRGVGTAGLILCGIIVASVITTSLYFYVSHFHHNPFHSAYTGNSFIKSKFSLVSGVLISLSSIWLLFSILYFYIK